MVIPKKIILGSIVAILLAACTPAVREAKSVVAQADSLWRAGMPCGDSIALAQAFTSLDTYQYLYPDDYAHACYHYGRLLREKENPVEAMQVFIHATHSHTRDYHILGRVYSNMGDICHLANEFDLSYDMFERSADMFLRNGDSLLYYYTIYRMAFEKAELGKREDVFTALPLIDYGKVDSTMLSMTAMIKACLYTHSEQYDSVVTYVDYMHSLGYNHPTGYKLKAQAFWNLSLKDSAFYYANIVLEMPNASLQDKYNVLYISAHYNSDITNEELLEITSKRADIGLSMDDYHSRHAQAYELLFQDLKKNPDRKWLYSLVITLLSGGISISIYVYRKHRKHELWSQKVNELEYAASVVQEKHDDLNARYLTNYQRMEAEIEQACHMLRASENIIVDLTWKDFDTLCHVIDEQFFMLASKLYSKKGLKEKEVRLCILVLLNMSRAEISDMLPYALNSVGKLKDQTAKLLGTTGKNLRQYLINLAIEG